MAKGKLDTSTWYHTPAQRGCTAHNENSWNKQMEAIDTTGLDGIRGAGRIAPPTTLGGLTARRHLLSKQGRALPRPL